MTSIQDPKASNQKPGLSIAVQRVGAQSPANPHMSSVSKKQKTTAATDSKEGEEDPDYPESEVCMDEVSCTFSFEPSEDGAGILEAEAGTPKKLGDGDHDDADVSYWLVFGKDCKDLPARIWIKGAYLPEGYDHIVDETTSLLCTAPNGKWWRVHELLDAVAEVEKLTRRRRHSPMSTQHLRLRYFEGFDKVGQCNGVPAYSAFFGT